MSEQQQPAPLAGRSLASSAAALWGLHNKWTAVTPSVGSPGDVPPTAKSYSDSLRESSRNLPKWSSRISSGDTTAGK